MNPVLYLHGFASSPGSAKIAALRPLLEPAGVVLETPDLNVPSFERLDYEAVVRHALDRGMTTGARAIVGSSLGALIALSVARRGMAVPLVLIAPALGAARRWQSRLPDGDPVLVFNHARGAEVPIHRAFFEQMTALDVDLTPPPSRVTAIMGTEDETVPYAIVEETWKSWEASGRLVAGSKLITIADGDHGLVAHAPVIRDAILEAVA